MKRILTILVLLAGMTGKAQLIGIAATMRPAPVSETIWNVNTASYDSKSFSTSTQTSGTRSFFINDAGTSMYATSGTQIYQYTISTPGDISTASYASKTFNASAQITSIWGCTFSGDGTKMYLADFTGNVVYQYTLSTPGDVSTASYASKSLTIASGGVTTLQINSDGTKFYAMTYGNLTVTQYSLSTGYDLSTASSVGTFSFGTQDSSPITFFLSSLGSALYGSGYTNNTVYQYTLSTPGTVSTATYASKSFSTASQATTCNQIFFAGSKMYAYMGQTIYQYSIN